MFLVCLEQKNGGLFVFMQICYDTVDSDGMHDDAQVSFKHVSGRNWFFIINAATQDPELRKKFAGKPEDVINFFYYVAQEVREIMASLGFKSIPEMVGRADRLKADVKRLNAKTALLDLKPILTYAAELRPGAATHCIQKQDHLLHLRMDNKLIEQAHASLETGKVTRMTVDIVNTDRAFGTTLSHAVSKRYGEIGLPDETICIKATGSAGQSFCAFLAPGILVELEGDANDYVGKGLSGGRIVVYPSKDSTFISCDNVIVGNVCLYGATSGYGFFYLKQLLSRVLLLNVFV